MFVEYHPGFRISIDAIGDAKLSQTLQIDRPGKVFRILEEHLGQSLKSRLLAPFGPISYESLKLVHEEQYLRKVFNKSCAISRVFEVPGIAEKDYNLLRKSIVDPMRLTVAGAVDAAINALKRNDHVACLGGGYHHAKASSGGGFCLFSDIAVSIAVLRASNLLQEKDIVLYIDTDAHMGNGIADIFAQDHRIKILDVYNRNAYPFLHPSTLQLEKRIDYSVPCQRGISNEQYLKCFTKALREMLLENYSAKLAFYNAGSDVLKNDPVGGMSLTSSAMEFRDRLTLDSLESFGIPAVVTPSGGYCDQSPEVYAKTILNHW